MWTSIVTAVNPNWQQLEAHHERACYKVFWPTRGDYLIFKRDHFAGSLLEYCDLCTTGRSRLGSNLRALLCGVLPKHSSMQRVKVHSGQVKGETLNCSLSAKVFVCSCAVTEPRKVDQEVKLTLKTRRSNSLLHTNVCILSILIIRLFALWSARRQLVIKEKLTDISGLQTQP